jgi:hypothetical protein
LTIEIKRIASLVQGNTQTNSQPRRGLLGSVFGRARNNGSNGSLELSATTELA